MDGDFMPEFKDPNDQEIARLIGDADWAGESAKAILEALMDAK